MFYILFAVRNSQVNTSMCLKQSGHDTCIYQMVNWLPRVHLVLNQLLYRQYAKTMTFFTCSNGCKNTKGKLKNNLSSRLPDCTNLSMTTTPIFQDSFMENNIEFQMVQPLFIVQSHFLDISIEKKLKSNIQTNRVICQRAQHYQKYAKNVVYLTKV